MTPTEPPPRGETPVIERARRYMATIEPAVSGSRGHDATYRAACKLIQGFGLSIEDALPLMQEWNQGCEPPWSDRDLMHKLEDAVKADGEAGALRGEPVEWSTHRGRIDRVIEWEDTIGGDDYQVIDPNWTEPVETVEPDQWDPVRQISDYLSALFSSKDHVGYVTDSFDKDGRKLPTRGCYGRTAGQLLKELAKYKNLPEVFGDVDPEVGAWIRFNPLDGQGVKDENVTDFRYALVESDKMPIDGQRGVYEELELPIAALVHSGNKSLHAIVRIDAESYTEYRKRVDLLYEVCAKNGLAVDSQNRNPSRLSRMPGVERDGKKQFLAAVNIGKKSWTEWEEWIEAVNDDLPDPESLAEVWGNLPPLSPPLIEGILRQGHKMLMAGSSKAGKSFLLIELCIAIAEGKKWLHWQCSRGRILYVNLELDRASCLHRFSDVYQALDWQPTNLTNIDIWNLRGLAVPMDKLAPKLIRRALKRNCTAVVIDPIYKVITGDENAADKMAFFCNQFDKVCHQLNAAVIYCHHPSKGSQGGKRSMDRASGSGVFARDPDALLDLIELDISDDLLKEEQRKAVCKLLAEVLDREVPGWRDKMSADDQMSESQMRNGAVRLMGDRFNSVALPLISETLTLLKRLTAWRIEGAFREYPRAEPVNCWFRHPVHELDDTGVLKDAEPQYDEDPRRKGRQKGTATIKAKATKILVDLTRAFNVKMNDPGPVRPRDIAGFLSKHKDTVRGWLEREEVLKAGFKIADGIITCQPLQDESQVESNEEVPF